VLHLLWHLRSQAKRPTRRHERFAWHPRVEALETRLLLSINEFPVRPTAAPLSCAAGPDGNIYYTEQSAGTNRVGVMDTSGNVLQEVVVPTANCRPEVIVAGPDGNMWFTEQGRFPTISGKIASISTDGSGTITEYAPPTPNSKPTDIIVGPDGNMWFTEDEAGSSNVAQLDLSTFTITEFHVPTPASVPIFLTSGPDGNIWFTEQAGNMLGMLDVAGGTFAITEFPVPTPASGPTGITVGPDGNIWFTESTGNNIGVLDLAGGTFAITEYAIPTPNAFSQSVIAGPDGNMWFSETGNPTSLDRLGVIDLAGGTYAITEYHTPTSGSAPVDLTLGPNQDDIWFGEAGHDSIGQLVFPPAPAPQPGNGLRTALRGAPGSIALPSALANNGWTPHAPNVAPAVSVPSLSHEDWARRIGASLAGGPSDAGVFAVAGGNLFAIMGDQGLLPALTQSRDGMADWLG
jgi:streptogramin lyase